MVRLLHAYIFVMHKNQNNYLYEEKSIMGLLKKVSLALFISIAMLATAPSVMAKPMGKIENKTPAETVVDIDKTLEISAETLKAIEDDVEKDTVMKMFKSTKQQAKEIESTVTYSIREKALGRLGKARLAFKKDKDKSEVLELMKKADDTFKELKARYHGFDGS